MSTLVEIEAALTHLTAEELMEVEQQLRKLQRARGHVIYDDAYGVWTEEDQASVAAEAWEMLKVKARHSLAPNHGHPNRDNPLEFGKSDRR